MNMQPRVQYASKTDVGMRRSANQDSFAARLCESLDEWDSAGHLFVVADGMGGHSVGDLASRITVDTLPHVYYKTDAKTVRERMTQAVLAANKAVNDRGRQNPEFADMGTTCSALSLSSAGAVVGHIGDSRVYRVRGNQVCQLTFDHSLQWEMIRLGRATRETVDLYHPRNVITRCLGPDPNVTVDLEGPFSCRAGDTFVLCSDGLTNHVSDGEIGQIVSLLPPPEASRLLLNLANCRGGSDNSTVIVVRVDDYPEAIVPTVDHADPLPVTGSEAATSPLNAGTLRRTLQYVAIAGMLLAVGLSIGNHWQIAVASGLTAVFCGGLSLLFPRGSMTAGRAPGDQQASDTPPAATQFPKSPYRVIEMVPTQVLLDLMAEIQGELVQAARDSGWKVDFQELTELSRQAAAGQQNHRPDVAMRNRARAIDLLMKELYQHSRSNSGHG